MRSKRKHAPSHPIRAFLFDLDGVLWFSVDAHRLAFEKAFHEMGFAWNFPRRTFGPYSGFTTEKALEHVLQDKRIRWDPNRHAQFGKLKRLWALRYLAGKTRLHPRLKSILRRLQRTHKLALVSSAHPETVKAFLKRSGTNRFFHTVISSGDVPYSKPDPRIYKAAMRRLGIRPDEGIAIEDSVTGATAAVRAGLRVIGMRGTCAPRLLIKTGAFKVISDLENLLPYATHS